MSDYNCCLQCFKSDISDNILFNLRVLDLKIYLCALLISEFGIGNKVVFELSLGVTVLFYSF